MAAGGGDLQSALGRLLAANVGEIQRKVLELAQHSSSFHTERGGLNAAVAGLVEQVAHLEERIDRIYVHALDNGRFACIGFGNNEVPDAALARCDGDRQHTGYRAKSAVEAEFANEQEVGQAV